MYSRSKDVCGEYEADSLRSQRAPVNPVSQVHCPVTASQLPSLFLQSHTLAQSSPQCPASQAKIKTCNHKSSTAWCVMYSITPIIRGLHLSCSCVQSSLEYRSSVHSQGGIARRSHTHTSAGSSVRNDQLDKLHTENSDAYHNILQVTTAYIREAAVV